MTVGSPLSLLPNRPSPSSIAKAPTFAGIGPAQAMRSTGGAESHLRDDTSHKFCGE